MAQRVVVELTSDLSGDIAQETVSFSLDGVAYEIELTGGEASDLRESLATYVSGGRKVGRNAPTARSTRRHATTSDYDASAVRAWAASRGIEVSGRGRISQSVLAQYREAGN
ncbi:histone-like nucleoid-structuring protein Lsr2 [Sanguibacter antarcticus]|uniref:Lsr2 protein n=1 Tax=Sanguibacter antarcticus TaxID=372484 RepID=A0A2A9E5G7_9MICO|nr:Lsr2 family protein [Sanguibacter antarcticus]PFG34297.1 Lsr2 protein [Sanguibacter antarcticus]